jgi:hypothetical protein
MKSVWESYRQKENYEVLKTYYDNSYFHNIRKNAKDKKKKSDDE